MKRLYLYVTNDKFEFPIAIADTQKELAEITGISLSAVKAGFSRSNRGLVEETRYKMVEIEENDGTTSKI